MHPYAILRPCLHVLRPARRQFLGQITTVFYLRGRPDLRARLRYRMALFPLPALIALAGWLWIFGTSPGWAIAYGAASLGLGIVVFPLWDRASRRAAVP